MGHQVLLADNDRGVRSCVDTALRAAGYDVVAVEGSVQALETLRAPAREARPSVLVTRMVFGGLAPNGLMLAHMARRIEPGLRVVFVSAVEHAPYGEPFGSVVAGPPVDVGKLVDHVAQACSCACSGRPRDIAEADDDPKPPAHADRRAAVLNFRYEPLAPDTGEAVFERSDGTVERCRVRSREEAWDIAELIQAADLIAAFGTGGP